jgi:hypothetical protein
MTSPIREFNGDDVVWDDLGHFHGPIGPIATLSFSPEGGFLAIGDESGLVVVSIQDIYENIT